MGARPPSASEVARCRFCGVLLSSAESHEELCLRLKEHGLLHSPEAIAAYASVDRGDFILGDSDPYLDAAAVMGFGAQVSAPHVHCAALELIQEKVSAMGEGLRVLDLGSGSGCMATLLARLLQGRGRVVALEHIQELVEEAKQNVAKHHADLMPSSLEILCEDALSLKAEPFDLIHCGAALSQVDDWLLKLLKPNGRAVAPLGPTDAPQWLCSIDMLEDGRYEVTQHLRVLYVPMTSEGLQRNRGDAWDEVVARCLENSADLT
ncbi:Protein-L-isoaspartate(D-aspartate) O-methyltransferase (PIMT) (L-isoaspartyl protein carboxyl methyltransferase) (Protein L-isoaspartyl/D-aspartyl methyltransferase) (Protein-beta-aspartate methyltransferase) [Durusdinium trenchii]|uniref:protein-L-isoaspartate(D-aspartate) O-methyltransferase n=1 Tax=Durusdinium trenchii TaxID=1381693 RepID=A0ABP0NL57_9DINO